MASAPSSDHIVLAWGSGEDGQLGMGDWEETERPSSITSLEPHPITSVVAGSRNSLAICDDGLLFTWGWNQRGTLGHPPETKTESVAGLVKALSNVRIVQAAIGGWHCLAVDDEGHAYAWGGNEYGQCGEEPERKDDGTKALRRDIAIPQRCAPKLSVRQTCSFSIGKMPKDKSPQVKGNLQLVTGLEKLHVFPAIRAKFNIMGVEKLHVFPAIRAKFKIMGVALSGLQIDKLSLGNLQSPSLVIGEA